MSASDRRGSDPRNVRASDRRTGHCRWTALVLICAFGLAAGSAAAEGGIQPESARDTWISATTRDEKGLPLIHSFRIAALELTNRVRYRWRIGISWRFG